MESDSQPVSSPGSSTHRFADLVGTVIALVTLIFPLLAIARYSPSQVETLQPTSYSIRTLRDRPSPP
ncbi:hypothetical protein [Lyngbya sp. CCY1209]|uniref:hypothetical protein n=1 Tax=Lyngbya sp. CCY1209 TaxID=2886103 RepID=UPI002D2103D1|nr:hypothetical protein [Lyngbya sp. CCY1209]MEB3886719.1 hypothetical protein [Lyngbya sp. CCY1209]